MPQGRFFEMRPRWESLKMLPVLLSLTLMASVLERVGPSPGFGRIAAWTFGSCMAAAFVFAPYLWPREG